MEVEEADDDFAAFFDDVCSEVNFEEWGEIEEVALMRYGLEVSKHP